MEHELQFRLLFPFLFTLKLFKIMQGSRSTDFGAEILPHSQCQKVCFFPNSRQKIPNLKKLKKKKKFFFFFCSLSLFHIIQIQNILYYIIYQEKR